MSGWRLRDTPLGRAVRGFFAEWGRAIDEGIERDSAMWVRVPEPSIQAKLDDIGEALLDLAHAVNRIAVVIERRQNERSANANKPSPGGEEVSRLPSEGSDVPPPGTPFQGGGRTV